MNSHNLLEAGLLTNSNDSNNNSYSDSDSDSAITEPLSSRSFFATAIFSQMRPQKEAPTRLDIQATRRAELANDLARSSIDFNLFSPQYSASEDRRGEERNGSSSSSSRRQKDDSRAWPHSLVYLYVSVQIGCQPISFTNDNYIANQPVSGRGAVFTSYFPYSFRFRPRPRANTFVESIPIEL